MTTIVFFLVVVDRAQRRGVKEVEDFAASLEAAGDVSVVFHAQRAINVTK